MMTPEQRVWAESKRRIRRYSSGGEPMEIVDYKEDNCGLGAFFIVQLKDGSYEEVYRNYPQWLLPPHRRVVAPRGRVTRAESTP